MIVWAIVPVADAESDGQRDQSPARSTRSQITYVKTPVRDFFGPFVNQTAMKCSDGHSNTPHHIHIGERNQEKGTAHTSCCRSGDFDLTRHWATRWTNRRASGRKTG